MSKGNEAARIIVSVRQDYGCHYNIKDLIAAVEDRLRTGDGPGYFHFEIVEAVKSSGE